MPEPIVIADRWRIVGELGAGGMGTVYEVKHERLGTGRALKQLKEELANRPDFIKRFNGEAIMMANLGHPHIVHIEDLAVEPGFGTYILMDLIRGSDLGKIIREHGPQPYSEVVRIGEEIASALELAHSKRVIHRDIKPGNILIEDGTGRSFLTDFGIAKQLHEEGDDTTDGTATGVFIGTYRYSSPEQLRGEDPCPAWDIYSLGVVLYEAYSGRRYLASMSENQIIAKVAGNSNWEPLIEWAQPPPEPFRHLVRSCLERDPTQRLCSASELIERLQACQGCAPVPERGNAPIAVEAPPPPDTAATVRETHAETRQALRAGLEDRLRELERVASLEGLGNLAPGLREGVLALQGDLRDVDRLEEEGSYEDALQRLYELQDRAGETARKAHEEISAAFAGKLEASEQRLRELEGRAGRFLPLDTVDRVGERLERARVALGDGHLDELPAMAGDVSVMLEGAEADAKIAARGELGTFLEEIKGALDELAGDGAKLPGELQLQGIVARVDPLLDAGRLVACFEVAQETRRALEEFQEARNRQLARLLSAREGFEAARDSLEIAEARLVAESDIEQAEGASHAAERARESGEWDAATGLYEEATRAFHTAGERLRFVYEQRCGEAVEALQKMLTEASRAPRHIVRSSRNDAQAAIRRAKQPSREAVELLQKSHAELSSALEEATSFADADKHRKDARRLHKRFRPARVAPEMAARIETLVNDAGGAYDRREWPRTRELYALAITALEEAAQAPPAVGGDSTPGRRWIGWVAGGGITVLLVAGLATIYLSQPPPQQQRQPPPIQQPPQQAANSIPSISISRVSPDMDTVHMKENDSESFALELKGAPSDYSEVHWTLDKKPIEAAQGKRQWEYHPGYDASTGSPHTVAVQVADGTGQSQSHSWSVEVADADRPPRLLGSEPPADATVDAVAGKELTFKVSAKDDDGDSLTYSWSIDGHPQKDDQPELTVQPRNAAQSIALTISDGKSSKPLALKWQVAALEVPPFTLKAVPERLGKLAFGKAQKFALDAPRDLRNLHVDYTWTVDDREASSASALLFKNDDSALVRPRPVHIVAAAKDDQGRTFEHHWDVQIVPPAPSIESVSPSQKDPLEVEAGAKYPLRIKAREPVGNQKLEYVFRIDGEEHKSTDPTYSFVAANGGDKHEIAAWVADNYGQRSDTATWTAHSMDGAAEIQKWLDEYRAAFNRKDIARLKQLMHLNDAKASVLADALKNQNELRVKFSDVQVQKVDNGRFQVSYRRVDDFTDGRTGNPQSLSTRVYQVFRFHKGKPLLESFPGRSVVADSCHGSRQIRSDPRKPLSTRLA